MIAKGCWHWIAFPLSLGLIIPLFQMFFSINVIVYFAGITFFALSLLLLIFFRDPERDIGAGITAPADGRVQMIAEENGTVNISTFMNIHNVHVNRAPADGKIVQLRHVAGSYVPAFKKESERNERVIIEMDTEIGRVTVIQIAGTVARRIVPYIKTGESVKKGQRLGIIRLGSRVDLVLPREKVKVLVRVGDKVRAGISVLAEPEE